MNTKTTSLPDTRAGEHKKTIEKSGIILMLLILVFLGMMSLDRSNKPENSGKDSASGVIATTSSETKNAVANSDLSDSVVPSEKVSTETESNGETDVGETTGYEGRSGYSELMSRYYGYKEKEFRAMLEKTGGIEEMHLDILNAKVADFLAANAEVNSVKAS